jgi:hypothetical protein
MLGENMKNLVMTYGAGASLFASDTFRVYVESLKHIKDAQFILLTHDIPDESRKYLKSKNVLVLDQDPAIMQNLFRDRHLAFWSFLNHHSVYDKVLVTDCRDVVFQGNPFDFVRPAEVILVSEGFKRGTSGFACIEHFEFQRDVPMHHLQDNKDRWVCNGGTMMGTSKAMQHFHFLMWMASTKTIGRCTDQATLNWMMHFLEQDSDFYVSQPDIDNFCLTGEGVKEGVCPVLDNGKLLNPKGEMYLMVHQWDRLDILKQEILLQYPK